MTTILGERQGEPVPSQNDFGDDAQCREWERHMDLGEQRDLTGDVMPLPVGAFVKVRPNYHKPISYRVIGVYPRASAADWFFEEEMCLP